jgi:hypothetical protein
MPRVSGSRVIRRGVAGLRAAPARPGVGRQLHTVPGAAPATAADGGAVLAPAATRRHHTAGQLHHTAYCE